MLAVATIVVVALVVGCVLVSLKPTTEYKGVLSIEEVTKSSSVRYSLETENKFKQDVSVMLEKMLASFFDTIKEFEGTRIEINNSSVVSEPLLSIFSKAGIPSDKLLNFSSYLKNIDTDEAVLSVWFYLIRIEELPDGKYQGRFATPTELAEIFTGEVDLGYAVSDVVKNTALTAEEVGRLLFELIYAFSDSEQQAVLTDVGRASFVSLFVSATTIYEAYVEFSLVGGSLSEARMLGELAYEMGAELDELLKGHGVKALLTAFLLNGEQTIDDTALRSFLTSAGVDTSTLANVSEVNSALTAGVYLAEFGLYFARTTLMEVGNAPFEYLAEYYAQEKENSIHYLYMHQVTLARALVKGMEDGLDEGDLIESEDELIEALANFKLTIEEVKLEIADPTARKAELKDYFTTYVNTAKALSQEFSGLTKVEDVATLSSEQLSKLEDYSKTLNDVNYNELMVGADSFASTLLINIIFNAMSQVMNDAIGGMAK